MQTVFVTLAVLIAAASCQLWGVTHENQLASLDAATGLWTLAGNAFADRQTVTLIQIADIDESANTFYVIAIDRNDTAVGLYLYGLSAVTAQIVTSVFLPFRFTFNYVDTPGVDYIPGTHDVLVYGANVDGVNYDIFRITPITQTVKKVASWTKTQSVIQSVDAYDPANNILWIQTEANNALTLLGFDVEAGSLVYNATDSYGFQSLNYDPTKKQTVGLGKTANGQTPVVALNGANGASTQLGQIAGNYVIAGPDNAGFDVASRQLYQYVDNGQGVEFITVNVDTATVNNIAYTDGQSVKPATIAFYN